jgi:hypothetical protein
VELLLHNLVLASSIPTMVSLLLRRLYQFLEAATMALLALLAAAETA